MRHLPDSACVQGGLVCTDAFGLWPLAYLQAVGFAKRVESPSSYHLNCSVFWLTSSQSYAIPKLNLPPVTGEKNTGYWEKAPPGPEILRLGSKNVLVFPQTLFWNCPVVVSLWISQKGEFPMIVLDVGALSSPHPHNKETSPLSIFPPTSLHWISWYSLVMLSSHKTEMSLGLWHLMKACSGMTVQSPHSVLQLNKFWGTLATDFAAHSDNSIMHWVWLLLLPRKHQGQGKASWGKRTWGNYKQRD